MTERVVQRARTVAIKLVLNRLHDLRPGGDRPRKDRIDVVDIEHQADGSSSQRLRTAIHLWLFVRQHDGGIADFDFRMRYAFAAGVRHAEQFGCPERFFIEINCCGGALDDEVWCYGVVALGNGFDWHGTSLLKIYDVASQ